MRLGIVGSRAYTNEEKVKVLVDKYIERYGGDLIIISGGCPDGGDFLAKKVALEKNVKYGEFPPIHAKHNQYCILGAENYGKPYNVKNYFARNTQIPEYCDHVVGL